MLGTHRLSNSIHEQVLEITALNPMSVAFISFNHYLEIYDWYL